MLANHNYINRILAAWKNAFSEKSFALKFLLTPGLFFIYSAITQKLGNFVEMRRGIILNDRLLYLFPSFDFSIEIFVVLYSSLLLVVVMHLNKPKIILRIIEMHFAVAIVRQICILLIALEPPVGIIVLRDVFLENTVYPRHSPLTKDLFFSGHVASVFLYYLCADIKWVKKALAFSVVLMCFMILSMKVHYTYDVYGAFFFTFILYKAPNWIRTNKIIPKIIRSRK